MNSIPMVIGFLCNWVKRCMSLPQFGYGGGVRGREYVGILHRRYILWKLQFPRVYSIKLIFQPRLMVHSSLAEQIIHTPVY